ncbi:hypothetical protein BXT89_15045 [Halopseudomonas pachastrellae]|uniref:ABC transporter domain-containing protein n=1 Tax=Halopseudomonas pachastrellae TaxID=254161 RepID=A0A1S8DCA8_9GAMM|nr:AAA family ATPase [Halopseudomonas pachastrellae]ONM43033.1 hypothetical protein BXT89_15045 [Halopseudomonas pachastrellae]SFL89598.1 ATPase/GTPase, AAA15 family [Halopseudomonas pachastrellae]
MAISQQVIHKLVVQNLKNLNDLEISFDGAPVTAILGPNGNGKSTILHALACAFEPNGQGEDYKFSSFFLPNTDALWNGSKLEIVHSYRDDATMHDRAVRAYKKTNVRWTPRYANRPKRDVFYIGIDKCVPMIESEKKNAKINYSTKAVTEEVIETILSKASTILNREYSKYNIHTASGKTFIGVEVDALRYSAISMSAGEQKIFYILERLYRAPKNSLLLIDELDLLLHDSAMKKLISVINERAKDKNLQVIFTTHRESVLELEGVINIRHIVRVAEKSLCFNETKPDAINRLTGSQPKPIEVFVEDDLASAIVKKIASSYRGARHVSIQRYGAAINCFTVVGGLLTCGNNCENSAFLLDGDVYRETQEKEDRLRKVIAGDDPVAEGNRTKALSKIFQFRLPNAVSPERFIHQLIIKIPHGEHEDFNEIIDAAKDIFAVDNDHGFLNDIIFRIGLERNTGLSKIVDLASKSAAWDDYISDIREWMEEKILATQEHEAAK